MLEVLTKFICFILMAIVGFYVIKKTTNSNVKLLNLETIIILSILVIIQMCLYRIQFTATYTIMVFLLNIIIYKKIFKITIEESIICCGILMIIMFFSDLAISLLFRIFVTAEQIRTNSNILLLANILISILSVSLINVKIIKNQVQKFYNSIIGKKVITNTIFFLFLVIGFSYLAYNIINSKTYDLTYFTNSIVMIVFVIVTYIFIKSKNNYNKLMDEYDNLFKYVQNFEEWIEKEQLNRHEYKNQLAVLRDITKENKTKKKIDEILEDNINIEGEIVNQLKALPKGGLKGLMYYKLVIAQKNKIDLTIDVSIKKRSILNKLSEKQIRDLCKLIGIYFDNAIEAAKETKKKNVLIEIYELKDKINIVFSNTFRKNNNFSKRNEKGISSKGKGRGNGLYFAKKIINKNNWLEEKQEVIDKYYIQKISILKLEN